jgi:hypothetical protein
MIFNFLHFFIVESEERIEDTGLDLMKQEIKKKVIAKSKSAKFL